MSVLGQTPTRIHLIDSESVTWEQIGPTYVDPNDPTKLVRDVEAHALPMATRLISSPNAGAFQLAHGLGRMPIRADIQVTDNAIMTWQAPPQPMFDATYLYLFASDDGVMATVYLW